ncbi:MAG: hypothetical protein KIT83_07640 [Bryobacterales bacterium]|nr:hypothetical protein [Bryobacterales bacterium]
MPQSAKARDWKLAAKRSRRLRWLLWLAAFGMLCVSLATGGYFFWEFYRVKPIDPRIVTLLPVWSWNDGAASVSPPSGKLLAEVEVFHDEILAFLTFDFLRSRPALSETGVLLVTRESGPRVSYRLMVETTGNWLNLYETDHTLREAGYIRTWHPFVASPLDWKRYEEQTRIFVAAYNAPVQRRLETLSPAQLQDFTRRFMLFKSRVDPRLRKRMQPPPPPILPEMADQLAADIIAVASFYGLPFDVFLGIAAVENNYMDMRGDLEHGVWKNKAEPGDIVLRRRGNRVYVLNYATGVWQITRETLRFSHRLYVRDLRSGKRDYSSLPPRLIPPETLYLDEVNSHWLTLYAGVLVRHLIDYFKGDMEKAIGAYNGGIGRPNARYEEHVRNAAMHARRVLEQAAALTGETVRESDLLRP